MTDNEIRVAIAESCGWKIVGYGYGPNHEPVFDRPDGTRSFGFESDFPNYTGDLNAMHEAEKTLEGNKLWLMTHELAQIVPPSDPIAHATAAQRAEAFLRVLGKWKD